jgi:hypothetical protein
MDAEEEAAPEMAEAPPASPEAPSGMELPPLSLPTMPAMESEVQPIPAPRKASPPAQQVATGDDSPPPLKLKASSPSPTQELTQPELPSIPAFTDLTGDPGLVRNEVELPNDPNKKEDDLLGDDFLESLEAMMPTLKPLPEPVPPPLPGLETQKIPDAASRPTLADITDGESTKLKTPQIAQPEAPEETEEKEQKSALAKHKPFPDKFKSYRLPERIYRKAYPRGNEHLPKSFTHRDAEGDLFRAVARNDLNGIRAFLRLGVPLSIRTPVGETLLMVAIRHGARDAANLLLMLGINPNEMSPGGITPLTLARQYGMRDVAELLKAAGAKELYVQYHNPMPVYGAYGNSYAVQMNRGYY